MEFKIDERYYAVTLTKRAKQNNFFKRFGNIKIAGYIKIRLRV